MMKCDTYLNLDSPPRHIPDPKLANLRLRKPKTNSMPFGVRRTKHQCEVRKLKMWAKRSKLSLKAFMEEQSAESSTARTWLRNKRGVA